MPYIYYRVFPCKCRSPVQTCFLQLYFYFITCGFCYKYVVYNLKPFILSFWHRALCAKNGKNIGLHKHLPDHLSIPKVLRFHQMHPSCSFANVTDCTENAAVETHPYSLMVTWSHARGAMYWDVTWSQAISGIFLICPPADAGTTFLLPGV